MLVVVVVTACNKENNKTSEEQIFVLLHLNMPFMPEDSITIFENPINEYLIGNDIGDVIGGGTALDNGMPTSNDVEIYIKESKKDEFIEYMKSLDNIGKGSYLEFEDEKMNIGLLEGLSLKLDGTGLEQSVYDTNDVNDVINDIDKKLANSSSYYSYYIGERYTHLYFYGKSYLEMETIIKEYIKNCSLCQNGILEKIN